MNTEKKYFWLAKVFLSYLSHTLVEISQLQPTWLFLINCIINVSILLIKSKIMLYFCEELSLVDVYVCLVVKIA